MSENYTAADWITRADMAVLMRSSTDTVKRVHDKDALETRLDASGRVLVNVGDYLRLGKIQPEDLTAGTTPAESAAVARARQTEVALRERTARLEGRLEQADQVIAALRDQLTAKDRQLGQRDGQITQLTALLGRFAAAGGAA